VRPTRVPVLLLVAVVTGVLAWLLAEAAYGDLPPLPRYAPATLGLLAVVEGGMAKVVRDRLRGRRDRDGRPLGRPLHPFQVARAVVLAKASSVAGAVLLGGYGGLLLWTLPQSARNAQRDALVSGLSAAAALALVVAALLLERVCRAPEPPSVDDERLGSTA
jgi:Protein of unknown function (DUF3180)